ncbi:MAG: gliding motility-associated C-terminal domain-containing protein [Lewinellaceae bacterium]|nr:gliding motility-associated C-terminal domain-containing protein [Lewinellaceae bacterium]
MRLFTFLSGFWAFFVGLTLSITALQAQSPPNTSISGMPTGLLTLAGPDTLCPGERATLLVEFSNGTDPYTFVYSINGVSQPAVTTNDNPHQFLTPPLTTGLQIIALDSVSAAGVFGMPTGEVSIVVRPAPIATLTSDTVAFCIGQTDTLRIRFSGPGPYTFQYSVRTAPMPADTMAAITTSDTLFLIPVMPPLGTTVYQLVGVSGDLCDGQVGGTYRVLVGNPPTATLTGGATICSGESATLRYSFTGDPPFVFTHTVNGVPQPPDTVFTSPFVQTVSPTDTTVYVLTGVSSNGCAGTVSGSATVQVLSPLSAVISGGGQVCQGGSGTTITITFEGPGPYTVVYRAGADIQPDITTTDNPLVITVNPPSGTFYQLESVSNGVCTGMVSGFALVAVFTPSTAELVNDITVCSGTDTSLVVDFTGSGPFLLEYSINGVVQPIVETFDDPYLIPVNVTDTTIYELISVESPGCFGSVIGDATVFINYAPQLTNLFISCDLVNQTYTIDFDALGTPPFVVTGVGGVFTGDHFTSDPIPLNDPYTLLLNDVNNCGQVPINGFSNCFCLSFAGEMLLDTLQGCVGDTAFATFLGFEELEVEDTLVFILHTNSNDTLGTILDVQAQPAFVFQPGVLTIGTTYYISPVAGNNNGMGGVNLNDPCLSVTPGTPIIWREVPTAAISGNFDLCPGESALIPVTLTGEPNFSLTYNVNGVPETVVVSQTAFTISATLLENTTFELVSVENAQCLGTVSGQVEVLVHPAPEITNFTLVCAPDNLSYTIEFDVENADLPTVLFSGVTGGSYNPVTGHFTGDPQPAQTAYSIIVSDAWQCGVDSISGLGLCPCTTEAGVMDQTPILLCVGGIATGSPATGTVLTSVDTLLYALVTTTSPATWAILEISDAPVFGFNPATMTTGTMYYIFAVAGLADPNGIDLSHPCVSVSVGSSVVWQPQPTVSLGSDLAICQGEDATLVLSFSGNAPYTVTYQAAGVNQPAITTSDPQFLVTLNPLVTTIYTLAGASANGCPADLSGSATVTVNPAPQIVNPTTNCNLAEQTYTLSFDVPNVTNPTVSGVLGTFSGTVFTSDPLAGGQVYNLTVSTPDGCTTTLTGSATCACITDAGTLNTAALSICLPDDATVSPAANTVLAPGEELQYILYQNPALLPAGILASSNTPQFAFQTGMLTETTYFIAAIAGLPLSGGGIDPASPCLSISPGVPVVFHNPPTAVLAGDTMVCSGSSTTFKIQFTGTAPFQFVYTVNGAQQTALSAPQNSFTISSNNVQQDQTYALVSVQDLFCTGTVSGTYDIDMQEGPTADISPAALICQGDSAVLTLQLTGASAFDVTINGGPTPIQLTGVQTGAAVTVFPTSTTTYTIGALVAQGNTCTQTIGAGATVTVSPTISATAVLSDYGGGFNVSCFGETDGSIALTTAGGTTPLTINWSNGASGTSVQNLGAGTYTVNITDGIGCTYGDSFVLASPEVLDVDFLVQPPACFGDRNGSILIEDVLGGTGPFTVSLDGGTAQVVDSFPFLYPNLAAGNYTVTVADLNGCEAELQAAVTDPPLLTVNLGMDMAIYLGDSIQLEAVVGGTPVDTFTWTPFATLNTPDNLITFARPVQTTVYEIVVQDANGCEAEDAIRVTVLKERRLYFPNAIKPGRHSKNGTFTVYAGPEVSLVRTFRIYDRWGECVFEKLDVKPNDSTQGWSGQHRGKDVLPGVYIYVVDLEYADGTTEVKSGDVTVVR